MSKKYFSTLFVWNTVATVHKLGLCFYEDRSCSFVGVADLFVLFNMAVRVTKIKICHHKTKSLAQFTEAACTYDRYTRLSAIHLWL